MEMETLKYYHNLYLKCDLLWLADVFGKQRGRCLENYDLCSSHHLSTPVLSWGATLSVTKTELDLISDVDMYLLFLKKVWGGVSYICKGSSKSNNKHLTSYDF